MLAFSMMDIGYSSYVTLSAISSPIAIFIEALARVFASQWRGRVKMRFILSDINMASQVVLEMQFQLGGRDQCQLQSGN